MRLKSILVVLLVMLVASATLAHADDCTPSPDLGADQLSRCAYAERLRAMWLGESIANWTGLTTEGVRIEPPFYTDADWGLDQNLDWKINDTIDFVLQDPWLSDDDTDIEYVYLNLLDDHATTTLTAQQIADGWKANINDFIWVANAQARGLMDWGALPPMTSMGSLNDDFLEIDAQLTTEIFGALAPGMPAKALAMADLPIRTTAFGYAAHAAQFYVVLYSLANEIDPALSRPEQIVGLVKEARKYIPDTSKSADIIDFVLNAYLANPDQADWTTTREAIYQRYHGDARANGFVYRDWNESSVNLAAGVLALLYGQGDFRRTVQIGALSGWDSDNGTATMGGLLGLMYGYDNLVAQFPDVQLSDHYHSHRTRPTMPDYLPDDAEAEDTFSLMAARMLPIVDQAVREAGGSVDGDLWTRPALPADELQANPLVQLTERSANVQVPLAGGTVSVEVSGDVAGSRTALIADGAEDNYAGQEIRRPPGFYHKNVNADQVSLSVTYSQTVDVAVIRLMEGNTNAFSQIEAELLVDGEWLPAPAGSQLSAQPDPTIPYQLIDVTLPEPMAAQGIRIIGTISPDALLPEVSILELDALAP